MLSRAVPPPFRLSAPPRYPAQNRTLSRVPAKPQNFAGDTAFETVRRVSPTLYTRRAIPNTFKSDGRGGR